jgi:hypothetical protein
MPKIWTVQVLTPDFLLEGKIDVEAVSDGTWSDSYVLQADRTGSGSCTALVSLTVTQFQPTSNLITADTIATNWTVCGANAFVAVIPRDEASTTFVSKQNKFKSLISADVFVGSYRFHGKVWSPEKPESGLSFLRYYSRFVMQDVVIDCQLPGAKLQGFQAAYAVIRTHLFQCARVCE